jgi:hypothetical protein
VSSNSALTRVFAVGVGDHISRHAIHTLGRVGGGAGVFVAEKEGPADIRQKMAKLVGQSLQAVLTQVCRSISCRKEKEREGGKREEKWRGKGGKNV